MRVDCNESTGYGHLSRCLSLARHLRAAANVDVRFVGEIYGFGEQLLRQYGIPWTASRSVGLDEPSMSSWVAADLVIVDSYEASEAYLETVAARAGALMVIADFSPHPRRAADLVLDFTVQAESRTYGSTRSLLGPKWYAPKPEFVPLRKARLEHTPSVPERILLVPGGSWRQGAMVNAVMGALEAVGRPLQVRLLGDSVTRPAGPEGLVTLECMRPGPEIETHFAWADLVVTGGGLTKYETAFCAVPNASVSTTEKQLEDSRRLHSIGLTNELLPKDGADESPAERLVPPLRRLLASSAAARQVRQSSRRHFRSESGTLLAKEVLSLVQ